MTELLLEKAGLGEEPLDNRQESSLIELMVCCVRQAATGEPPVGRAPARRQLLSKEQAKQVLDDKIRMTTHFIVCLPQLLDKFGADPDKLSNLVSVPQYFHLDTYTTQRQEGNLTLLLNKLRDIVSVQTEGEVLEACGRTLELLCDEQSAVYTRYVHSCPQNLTLLLNKLRDIVSVQTEGEVLEACGRTLELLCDEQSAVYTRYVHSCPQNLTLLLNKLRDIVSVQTEGEVLEACGRTLELLCDEQSAVYTRYVHSCPQNLTLLLNKLRDIVSVQTEGEVLEACGRTLELLCDEQSAVYTRCNVARATLTDMCVNRYKEAIDEYRSLLEGNEEPDADETFNVLNSLRKVSIMYMCHNLNDTNIWQSLMDDLPQCHAPQHTMPVQYNLNDTNIWQSLMDDLPQCHAPQHTMPVQALVYVIRSLFYSLLWGLHSAEARGEGVPELRRRLLQYMSHCTEAVRSPAAPELREEVLVFSLTHGAVIVSKLSVRGPLSVLLPPVGPALGGGARRGLRRRLLQYMSHCTEAVRSPAAPELREEAYISICDLLILFAEQLCASHRGPGAAAWRELVLTPDDELADLLDQFVQERVFVHQNYDGQDERRIEELHKRRNFLAAYCKLIVYNVIPIRRAADVFKHYIKCYNDYGDIIKATLSKAREMNKLSCALSCALAMQAWYTDKQPTRPAHIQELKELAKRFSVMFGLDAMKNREALTALHRAGISFAAIDAQAQVKPNLLFLEALAEFSNKLLRQDKRAVLKFLDSRLPSNLNWGPEWAPLQAYRTSLLTDSPDERPPPPPKKHYARRTRGHHDEDEAEDNAESDPEHGKRSRRRVRLKITRTRTSLPRRRAPPSPPSPSIHDSSTMSQTSSKRSADESFETPRSKRVAARRQRILPPESSSPISEATSTPAVDVPRPRYAASVSTLADGGGPLLVTADVHTTDCPSDDDSRSTALTSEAEISQHDLQ
ncbi:unnamed protein product [Plutella xylostella]|uniref:(diamondback moth) hypothetical protein n=1 Tax=Plutella xylostella TaxID=51655 RepID=A0A8S4CWN3_PLUXY|nr:unnamed protein product [Plutella xylostella]